MSKNHNTEKETSRMLSFEGREVSCHTVASTTGEEQLKLLAKAGAYASVLLVFGGADDLDKAKFADIKLLLRRGLLPAVGRHQSIIIDGGTQSGIMQLMGEAVAEENDRIRLIGVAPEAKVSYPGKTGKDLAALDPNHTDFFLVESTDWGDETATLFKLAAGLAAPIAAVLAGGGPVASQEILTAVRKGIGVLIIRGSGGFADQLAVAWDNRTGPQPDKVLKEILTYGELSFCELDAAPEVFRDGINRLLTRDEVLADAWALFAKFDLNAGTQQTRHKRYQYWLIWTGIAAAFIAIVYHSYFPEKDQNKFCTLQWLVYGLSVTLPVVLTVITIGANYFKNGKKWVFFRAAAENFKREIYAYRTRTGAYRENGGALLGQRISDIEKKAMASEITSTNIELYDEKLGYPPKMYGAEATDDGFSKLQPEDYIRIRLNGQISYYQGRVATLRKKLDQLHWCTYIIAGLGTLLAVFELQAWIALATTITTTIGSWLGQMQWESSVTTYNQNVANLDEIRLWWKGLSPADRFLPANRDSLVLQTETTLKTEYDGWVQQMKQSLEDLEKKAGPGGGGKTGP
jgi:hypothetical protein